MSLDYEANINSILQQVAPWPESERVALAYMILRDMRKKTREAAPRDTLKRAMGIAKGTTAPPDVLSVPRMRDRR